MGSSSSTSSNSALSGSSSLISSNDVKNKSKEDLANSKVEYSTLPCDVVDESTTLHVSIGKNNTMGQKIKKSPGQKTLEIK